MKKKSLALSILFLAGCQSHQPDYLTMISPADLDHVLQKEDIFLMDVHIPEQKHIKGTDVFIPYNEVGKAAEKLPQDKNTPIYLYCRSGSMANTAAKTLHELGYRKLLNLEGGTIAWKKAGLAVE